jgi:large subunit ribosomal protein L9
MSDKEVLLRETVKDLGIVGDVVRVRPGFARNYLFPRKLATEATEDNKRLVARKRQAYDLQQKALLADLEKRVAALGAAEVSTTEKADANGHLYGSVGAARIAQLLVAQGFEVEEGSIRLERPIKTVGSHQVVVHVHGERSVEVAVEVEAEARAEASEEASAT